MSKLTKRDSHHLVDVIDDQIMDLRFDKETHTIAYRFGQISLAEKRDEFQAINSEIRILRRIRAILLKD